MPTHQIFEIFICPPCPETKRTDCFIIKIKNNQYTKVWRAHNINYWEHIKIVLNRQWNCSLPHFVKCWMSFHVGWLVSPPPSPHPPTYSNVMTKKIERHFFLLLEFFVYFPYFSSFFTLFCSLFGLVRRKSENKSF